MRDSMLPQQLWNLTSSQRVSLRNRGFEETSLKQFIISASSALIITSSLAFAER